MSRVHWIALAVGAGVGGRTVTRLLACFGSLEAVFAATPDELMQVPQVGPHTAQAIACVDLAAIEMEVSQLAAQGIQAITWEDPHYPTNLLLSNDAPPVLFVRGVIRSEDARAVAVVGTRTPTPPSRELARHIGRNLAMRGWTVVSGLAVGIDTAAHQGALDVGGRTLAVLGSGVANVYPPQNRALAEAIEQCGAVICEVHPLAAVSRQHLSARNRITSGLSRAVIVVQSGEDSGSINTARRAQSQGRTVFAVIGGDAGCKSLLAEGAVALRPDAVDWGALSAQLDAITLRPARRSADSEGHFSLF